MYALFHPLITGLSHCPEIHKKHNTSLQSKHTQMHRHIQALTNIRSFLSDMSVHDSLAANPSVGWMSVPAHSSFALSTNLATVFISGSSQADN